ncbi:hypothetical protein V495_00913 [Pseudogymnoascus sp. VKM F-4514 (FW-929)]|nr:hypothetical protein V495_00913 [Pseudogymnoascus sp. VKM F-4514 (FW-929)]KFY63644.1 hypothetical protein V497_01964 [Pseudogymnoascus sp. VKM F-4516 (FW-969)]
MLKGENIPDRIARWQMRFSQYYCDFIHVPGKELDMTDGLSRLKNAPVHAQQTEEKELIAMHAEPDPLQDVGRLNVLIEDDLGIPIKGVTAAGVAATGVTMTGITPIVPANNHAPSTLPIQMVPILVS